MELVDKFLCYGRKPFENSTEETIKESSEVRYWVFLTDLDNVVLSENSIIAECHDQGLLLTQKAKEPARYRGATMIYDFSAAQFIFVEDFKDGGVAKGYYFGGTTYEVASEPERIKEAEEGLRAILPFILDHYDLIDYVKCVEFLRNSIYRLCKIKVNHPDGNGYIIPISNLPFLPSNGLTFDFYNYTYSEQFTGEVVDCGINEITIKVQGELFTLKNKDFNQNANISIVREMSPDEILDVEKVANFIDKDDPISKLRDLADNTKQ